MLLHQPEVNKQQMWQIKFIIVLKCPKIILGTNLEGFSFLFNW